MSLLLPFADYEIWKLHSKKKKKSEKEHMLFPGTEICLNNRLILYISELLAVAWFIGNVCSYFTHSHVHKYVCIKHIIMYVV